MAKTQSENLHSGHRKRLRKELLELDFADSIPDHKVLETLLFYGVPRKDTNPIAHSLLNKFGSFSGVLEADPHELLQVEGMTENAVTLIKLIIPIYRRYEAARMTEKKKFTTIDQIGEFLIKKYAGYKDEVFMVTTFKQDGTIIACEKLAEGDSGMVQLTIKAVVQNVLKHNAPCVVVSHNHPNGTALPSQSDIDMTDRLKKTLLEINVNLVDHIIVAGNDYVSFKSSRELKPYIIIK